LDLYGFGSIKRYFQRIFTVFLRGKEAQDGGFCGHGGIRRARIGHFWAKREMTYNLDLAEPLLIFLRQNQLIKLFERK